MGINRKYLTIGFAAFLACLDAVNSADTSAQVTAANTIEIAAAQTTQKNPIILLEVGKKINPRGVRVLHRFAKRHGFSFDVRSYHKETCGKVTVGDVS